MNLFANVEAALKSSLSGLVGDRVAPVELDVHRLGGDISTLANKLGELMDGLQQHRDVIQNLARQHHQLVSALNARSPGGRMSFPPLHKPRFAGKN